MPRPKKADPWVVRTQPEVARFFGVAPDTITRAWRRAGMPGKAGAWDLREILLWRDERFGGRTKPESTAAPAGAESRAEAERRRATADADLRELRARRAAKDLVPVQPVQAVLVRHANEAKAILDQVPDRVLGALPTKMKAATRRRIHAQCRQIVDDACTAVADSVAVLAETVETESG